MVFNSFIFILSSGLFELSNCVDIYHPQYSQNAPITNYGQPNQYVYPHQSGMYYQGSALDEPYHHDLDYHPPQSQQNYGQISRRSLPPFTVRQIPCPHARAQQSPYRCYRSIPTSNYPQYPFCHAHDYPTVNYNDNAGLIVQQERDSRSTSESSTIQTDNLIPRSPVYIPNYSTNTSLNKTRSKRSVYKPTTTSYKRPNSRYNSSDISEVTPPNTDISIPINTTPYYPQTIIIGGSRKLVILNSTSPQQVQERSNFGRESNAIINHPPNKFNNNIGLFNKLNNEKMLMDARSSGSTGSRVQYVNNFPQYQSHTGQHKSFTNHPIKSDFRFANFKQPLDSFIQQPILSYGTSGASGNSYKRYGRMNSARSPDYFPMSSLPLSSNDNEHVNHKTNIM